MIPDNPLQPGSNNADLIEDLEKLPEEVAKALLKWRQATIDREKTEALLYLRFKGEDKELTGTEIKAKVHADSDRYRDSLFEAIAESEYTQKYEQLMAAKRLSGLRTAF